MINLVLVILVNSSSRLQNLVTFASSNGASTSSKTHIGDGLVKNTAKIYNEILALPLFPGITKKHQDAVINVINSIQ